MEKGSQNPLPSRSCSRRDVSVALRWLAQGTDLECNDGSGTSWRPPYGSEAPLNPCGSGIRARTRSSGHEYFCFTVRSRSSCCRRRCGRRASGNPCNKFSSIARRRLTTCILSAPYLRISLKVRRTKSLQLPQCCSVRRVERVSCPPVSASATLSAPGDRQNVSG